MSQQCMKAQLLPVFFDIFVLFATYQSPAASSKRLMLFFAARLFLNTHFLGVFLTAERAGMTGRSSSVSETAILRMG